MADLPSTIAKLGRAQQVLLKAADAVPSSEWNAPPDRNSCFAAHLIAHLCQVERGMLSYADRVIRKAPRSMDQALSLSGGHGGIKAARAQDSSPA
jgi:hypothetical protein